MTAEPTFDELLGAAKQRALHLELRDRYMASPRFDAWKQGISPLPNPEVVDGWHQLVGRLIAVGADVRRARVVSEPLSDYSRFLYDVTDTTNLAAGEQVRWLARQHARDLAVPLNDFWVIDDRLLLHYFSGDGEWAGHELTDDPELVKLCVAAFEAVWERATDHADYRPA